MPEQATTIPARIHFNRFRGEPLPTTAKLVTRPGRYGNPEKVTAHGSAAIAVAMFRQFLADRRDPPPGWVNPHPNYPSDEQIRQDLAGYDLACACQSGAVCHGDPLLEIANGGTI